MKSDNPNFDVGPGRELREKYYAEDERPPALTLNPSNVPPALHFLIPQAEKRGISDDILRIEAIERAAEKDRQELKECVTAVDGLLDDWLAGPEASGPNFSAEYVAFTCLRLSADEC